PDESAVIDLDAVFAPDPLVTLPGTAPGAQQVALGVEFQHRRRRDTAFRSGRRQACTFFIVGERTRPVYYPDMALGIDGDAAELAENPVVRQRLWPRRLDFETGNFGCLRA